MIPFIERYLIEKFSIEPISILLQSRQIRNPKLGVVSVMVNYVDKDIERTFAIVKFPRYVDNSFSAKSIESEYNNLSFLINKLASNDLLSTVPKALFYEKINNVFVLGQSPIFGQEMAANILCGPSLLDTFANNLQISLNWLIEFQNLLGFTTINFKDYIKNILYILQSRLKELNYNIDLSKLEKRIGNIVTDNSQIIIYPQHGDFHASNLFTDGNKITGIIDWEDFSIDKLPPCFDFIHFVFTYLEALYDFFASNNNLDLIIQLQNSQNFVNLMQQAYEIYCDRLKIDKDFIEIYLYLYLIQALLFAADERKFADTAIKKYILLLTLLPSNFSELLLLMPLKNYVQIKANLLRIGDKNKVQLCDEKIEEIKRFLLEKAN